MRRRESRLLDLGEVVLGVLIENDLPELAEREVLVRPDFGEVKDVVTELLGLFRRHSLLGGDTMSKTKNSCSRLRRTYDVDGPARILLIFDRLEEALDSVLWI